ncbi:MAG TPA: NAD(P)/FAD-dependent oxidoreductase [Chloroflexia bacterium]|nr:NAD(P)/FAD-dependent oxidoreductase [Chloroflexia bacterium]
MSEQASKAILMAAQESAIDRKIPDGPFDAIIVGGSFAGLAAATQLRGFRVLLIDQRPIGTHQTSTCAIPLATAQATGTLCAIQEVHGYAVIHTAGREYRYKLNEPYVTLDYYAFCQAMLAQTDVELWLAKATGYENGVVSTTRGSASASFVIDASGWQSLVRKGPSRDIPRLGYGVETELPVRLPLSPGLHFYFENRIVRSGYAWVFPCGARVRIGVCSMDRDVRLGPVLDIFLDLFGLQRGVTHGGPMPVALRQPSDGPGGKLFAVGDACGQCMPLWAEGIRQAIYFSMACGQAVASALDGPISADEARKRYATLVRRKAGFHTLLLYLQGMVALMPDGVRRVVLAIMAWPPLARCLISIYLHGGGWVQSGKTTRRRLRIAQPHNS